jgi:bacillithiol system protein YtxJ
MSLIWLPLISVQQIDEIRVESEIRPILIFKHSTRCTISSLAKFRLESDWTVGDKLLLTYFLDLLKYREVSNSLADVFSIPHASPQVLLVHKTEVIYDASHLEIKASEIMEALPSVQ